MWSTVVNDDESNDEASSDDEEISYEELTQTCSTLYNKLVELVRENKRPNLLMLELIQEKDDSAEVTKIL